MTANEIKYVLKQYDIEGKEWHNFDDKILYISFADATKTKRMDKLSEFKFDFSNEVVVQRRKRKDGKVICYPGTETECLNIFSFDSILIIGRRATGGKQ